MASIRRRPNGKWRARYRDPAGTEHARHFARRVDAERWLDRVRGDLARGTYVDPRRGRTTYAEWSERYFAGALHKRPTTLIRDRTVNEKHFLPVLGSRALSSITPLDVRRLVESLARRLAPATVRTNYGVLRAVLRAAVDADVIAVSPCRGVKLPAQRRPEIRFLSAEELTGLAAQTPTEYRPMIYLAGVLGLRLSEVAGLRVGRINFLRHTLEVAEACVEVEGQPLFSDVKTQASRRRLSVPPFLMAMLAERLAARDRPNPDELVFVAPEGGPLRGSTFRNRVFYPAVRRAGLDGLTFHGLRHTAAGLMVEAGAHVEAIKQRLGHSSIRVTSDVYGSLLPAVDESVTSALDARFTDSRTDGTSATRPTLE
jgi:integrase